MARLFNGTSDFIRLPFGVTDAIANQHALSISTWFKGSNANSCIRLQTAGNNYVVLVWFDGANPYIMSNDGGTTGGLYWPSTIYNGDWHHLASSWGQNATMAIYLDGSLVISRAAVDVQIDPMGHVSPPELGTFDELSEFTAGALAQPAIWIAALTPSEISALAGGASPGSIQRGSLVSFWPLNGSNPEPDTISGFDGTLSGTTFVSDPPPLLSQPEPFSSGDSLIRIPPPLWY